MAEYTVFFFPSGVTACCKGDNQVPELQQSWLRLYVDFLLTKGIDPANCELNLPDKRRAEYFRHAEGYNFRIK